MYVNRLILLKTNRESEISFRVQFNVVFTRQVMNFP